MASFIGYNENAGYAFYAIRNLVNDMRFAEKREMEILVQFGKDHEIKWPPLDHQFTDEQMNRIQEAMNADAVLRSGNRWWIVEAAIDLQQEQVDRTTSRAQTLAEIIQEEVTALVIASRQPDASIDLKGAEFREIHTNYYGHNHMKTIPMYASDP